MGEQGENPQSSLPKLREHVAKITPEQLIDRPEVTQRGYVVELVKIYGESESVPYKRLGEIIETIEKEKGRKPFGGHASPHLRRIVHGLVKDGFLKAQETETEAEAGGKEKGKKEEKETPLNNSTSLAITPKGEILHNLLPEQPAIEKVLFGGPENVIQGYQPKK